jgi:hypothetical protein
MKVTIEVKKEIDLATLVLKAEVRYWEDANVNGVSDENGDLIPCRHEDLWVPAIDIDTGVIHNWVKGTTAEIHYKVCDCCGWQLLDADGKIVMQQDDGYVPNTLCPKETPDGDYIVMDIDENGKIDKWNFDIDDFQEDWE